MTAAAALPMADSISNLRQITTEAAAYVKTRCSTNPAGCLSHSPSHTIPNAFQSHSVSKLPNKQEFPAFFWNCFSHFVFKCSERTEIDQDSTITLFNECGYGMFIICDSVICEKPIPSEAQILSTAAIR
jgi:hypothetical protein